MNQGFFMFYRPFYQQSVAVLAKEYCIGIVREK